MIITSLDKNYGDMYTLVDENGNPVYTDCGMDGYFVNATSFGDMLTFTRKIGWSQMMELARWSQTTEAPRKKVFPAKVKLVIERIPIE